MANWGDPTGKHLEGPGVGIETDSSLLVLGFVSIQNLTTTGLNLQNQSSLPAVKGHGRGRVAISCLMYNYVRLKGK